MMPDEIAGIVARYGGYVPNFLGDGIRLKVFAAGGRMAAMPGETRSNEGRSKDSAAVRQVGSEPNADLKFKRSIGL